MNAHQRRIQRRAPHYQYPLGTLVRIKPGHHSKAAVGLVGKVCKHFRPARMEQCLVEFSEPVQDVQFGAARYCHYTWFRRMKVLKRAPRDRSLWSKA